MKKRKKIRIGAFSAALFVSLTAWGITGSVSSHRYKTEIELQNQKALTELCEYMDSIEVALTKSLYTNTDEMLGKLTSELQRSSAGAKENLSSLLCRFEELTVQAEDLKKLSCRSLITFHDGFSYLAESLDLHILFAIEEESGSEASAHELIEIISEVQANNLPAIFTEVNGAASAAEIIQRETCVAVFSLDMAMSKRNYFEAMEYNIATLKEALE